MKSWRGYRLESNASLAFVEPRTYVRLIKDTDTEEDECICLKLNASARSLKSTPRSLTYEYPIIHYVSIAVQDLTLE